MTEHSLLAGLPSVLGPRGDGVRVGIGDDAACLDGDLVWTVDTLVDRVHALRAHSTLEDMAFRATMTSASDLAAMGASPLHALAAVTVTDEAEFGAVRRGQEQALAMIGAPIVGGNLARGRELSITTTWLGRAARPLLRSGARVGDGVFLAGPVGLAAAGLAGLLAGRGVPEVCVTAHRRPTARIADGLLAAKLGATSAIDVSDGLAADATHVARASHVRLRLDGAAILSTGGDALSAAARALGVDALRLALTGGDDYALLLTGPVDLGREFVRIGDVEAGPAAVDVYRGGAKVDVAPGFDHLRGG